MHSDKSPWAPDFVASFLVYSSAFSSLRSLDFSINVLTADTSPLCSGSRGTLTILIFRYVICVALSMASCKRPTSGLSASSLVTIVGFST